MNPSAFTLNAISMQPTYKWVPPTKCVYFIWLTWLHAVANAIESIVILSYCHTGILCLNKNIRDIHHVHDTGTREHSWRSSVSVQVSLLGHNRAVHRTLWMRSIIATFSPSFHPLWSLGRLWMHNLIMQGLKYCSSPLQSFVHWRIDHWSSLFYGGKKTTT